MPQPQTNSPSLCIDQGGGVSSIAEAMLRELSPLSSLLDIGCGNGTFGCRIKKAGIAAKVLGVDLDPDLIGNARELLTDVKMCDINSDRLPFADESFEALTALEVIEHVPNIDHLVQEMHRVLRPNGLLIVSTPNIQCLYHVFRLITGHGPRTSFGESGPFAYSETYDRGHVNYFTNGDLKDVLSTHFKSIRCTGNWRTRKAYLSYILRVFSRTSLRVFLSPGLVVQANRKFT